MNIQPERLIAIELFGLDPGKTNGALTKWTSKKIETWNLSKFKTFHDYCDFWRYQAEICKNPLVALEKINMYPADLQDVSRAYRLEKLKAHYVELRSSLKTADIPYIEVTPREWQSDLKIYIPGEDYPTRKKRYKDIADEHYPFTKITQINADSYLLVEWLRNMIRYSPLETNNRIIRKNTGINQIKWKK